MSIVRFRDLGEAAAKRILRGWCGPLVPEDPTPEHDHRKRRLMYMDCTSPDTLEGHVLTFTMSTYAHGAELVFESGQPAGEPVEVGRRVLDWSRCWSWIKDAGLDCTRPEVQARLLHVCMSSIVSLGAAEVITWNVQGEVRNLLKHFDPGPHARVFLIDGELLNAWSMAGRSLYPRHGDIAPWTDGPTFVASLVHALAPKIASLP